MFYEKIPNNSHGACRGASLPVHGSLRLTLRGGHRNHAARGHSARKSQRFLYHGRSQRDLLLYRQDGKRANNEVAAHNSLTCDSLDYDCYQDDTLLSVLIRRVYFSHTVDYSVYNFNVKTGRRLSSEALCEAVGKSYDSAMATLESKLKYDYAGKYATASQPKNYEEDLKKTMSEDNLKASLFFLDSKGKLNAVCKEYTSVGTGEFSVVLSL